MDSRAKQRLTGAVILVALFVLLVPELLTGPKDAVAPATAEEEGLRRYTIDLNAPSSPAAQAPDAAVALPPVDSTSERAQPGEAAAPAPPEVEPPAAPSQPAAVAAAPAQGTSRPATATTDTPATRAAPAAPAAQAPRDTARPAAAAPAPGSFVVQLGSFSSRDNADRLVRDMTAKGFNTFIAPITTNGRTLYRVRVGPTRDRGSAEALAAQLKRMGQSGAIVPIP